MASLKCTIFARTVIKMLLEFTYTNLIKYFPTQRLDDKTAMAYFIGPSSFSLSKWAQRGA